MSSYPLARVKHFLSVRDRVEFGDVVVWVWDLETMMMETSAGERWENTRMTDDGRKSGLLAFENPLLVGALLFLKNCKCDRCKVITFVNQFMIYLY